MHSFIELFPLVLESFLSIVADKVFWVLILLIAFLYRRSLKNSLFLFDLSPQPVWPAVLAAVVLGVVGGFAGSFLLITVGVSLSEIAVDYLWVTALLLMLIEQRFLCFAYAGGLLSLSYLLTGYPALSVAHLMGLVAVLHLVESFLIYLGGHLFAAPVYVRKADGRIVGGYNMLKFWPLPVVALWTVFNVPSLVEMPSWWPLLRPVSYGAVSWSYSLMAVVAALGYGDVTLTERPREKTRRSARELACYSVILLGLAILAGYVKALSLLPALFGPLGHEWLIRSGRRRELAGEPLFVPPERGVMVLDVLWKSPLKKAGLRGGDIILTVAGAPVENYYQIQQILAQSGDAAEISFLSGREKRLRRVIIRRKAGQAWGFIPVPDWYDRRYMELRSTNGLLGRWLKSLWK